MTITLNGKTHLLANVMSLQQLLNTLELTTMHIAIEHNGEIIPNATYADIMVTANDQIEIIHFVGGG